MPKGQVFADPHVWCTHRKYKLTCEQYDELATAAARHCSLCGAVATLEIDHDHAVGTWAVRGLVCHTCNCAMRRFDSGEWPATAQVQRYLAAAWFIGRSDPGVVVHEKRARDFAVEHPLSPLPRRGRTLSRD